MSRESLAKLLIVVGTGVVCGGLLWWWQGRRAEPAPAAGGAAATAGEDATPGAGESVLLDPASMEGTVLDEAAAKVLFRGVRDGKRQMYDPVAWAVLKPDTTGSWKFEEHEGGVITSVTNNLGFRKDVDTQVEKHGPRILIAGDSHTDGMVDNDETFAQLLEERLNAREGQVPCEVLNGGVGATGPQNYLGTLKRNLYLKPDVFVAVLFTGNDFLNALAVSDFFSKRKDGKPSAIEDYQRLMMEAYKTYGAIVIDRFNQPLKFTRFPEVVDIALQASVDAFLEMDRICRAEGIRFVAVVLPTKPDADGPEVRATLLELLAAVGLSEEQFGVNARLGQRLAEALRAQGVQVVDCTERLRATNATPHYWEKDWHLNVAGHVVVAELLAETVEPLLAP
jgi:lysophospholipase L1-like esterase